MEAVETLIVGAGITGLTVAGGLGAGDYALIERDDSPGGYCKTIEREGFVWDYSGHFFHFKHPEIEAYLRARMTGQEIRRVEKRSFIRYAGRLIDFPFQKNIHQLPQAEFIDCLHDLYFARARDDASSSGSHESFLAMLYARFGRSISEKFLVPYNEKLYACPLSTLDPDAMGRFFPHVRLDEVIANMRVADNASYNQTFTYPKGGAFEYVRALLSEVPADRLSLSEPLVEVDLERHVARTSRRELSYRRLVSSVPLPVLLRLARVPHDAAAFSWNRVLVFNLGFDRKGPTGVHWIYYPDRARVFYRVGFYDNIFDSSRMSLYVEIGLPRGETPDVPCLRARVLDDLKADGIIQGHELVAEHAVVMDPAYVHVTARSTAERDRLLRALAERDVYSIGRYGGWTYCSIEDNIVEARALLERWGAGQGA